MGCGCKSGSSSSRNLVKRTAPRGTTIRKSGSSSGRIIRRIIK